MSKVECPYCGESYPITEAQCPLCGADNPNPIPDKKLENVVCPCCGDEYPITQDSCPVCQRVNPMQDVDNDTIVAELIDEESDYVPPKQKKPYKKQDAPDSRLVLAAFIGIFVIIIILFVSAASGISRRATSKIGVEIFESQDYDYHRNTQ